MLITLPAVVSAPLQSSSMPRLSCVGTHFEANGKKVLLQGVNLGGWFLTELWMTPWQDENPKKASEKINDDEQLYHLLAVRFGHQGAAEIRSSWRSNWVTESDFREIHKVGFNFVRIPFRDELIHEPEGLNWLKKAVGWARENHLWAVLDMHGVPGGQSKDQTTGWGGRNEFWTSAKNMSQYVSDWALLAKTFGSDPAVAMFDLVNEPSGAPATADIYMAQGRALEAIRKTAPKVIISIEDGFRGYDQAPDPGTSGWKNVCFQPHQYNFDAKNSDAHITALQATMKSWDQQRTRLNAPFYVGEWNVDPFSSADTISRFVKTLRSGGYSWSFWTWKVYPAKDSLGDWGINREPASGRIACDPFNDSKSEILSKLKKVQTKFMSSPPDIRSAFGLRPSP